MKKIIFTVVTTISFLFFGCASTNTSNKPEDYYSENYRPCHKNCVNGRG